MDFVRYILAMSVIIAHFNELCGGDIYWPLSSGFAVGGFFTMSGFLVYGSYERHKNFKKYVASRAFRILPPYFLIVLLCAFGLVAVSTLSAKEYFLSSDWVKYLLANLSFLNFLHPTLPGVFEGPEYFEPAVNGSLWTMKVEWCLYLSVPVVAWVILKLRKVNKFVIFWAVIILSLGYKWLFNELGEATGNHMYEILERQVFGQLAYFYVGVIIYYALDSFLRYKYVILAALVVVLSLQNVIPDYQIFLSPIANGVLVMWVSLVGRWGKYFSQHDNVSYDMYLFHYPILQLGVYFGLIGRCGEAWAFVIVTIATIVLSCISWNFVGRKAMNLKKKILQQKWKTN